MSTFNEDLPIGIKKIHLFCSNVVDSFWQAFLVDAFGETSSLDKPAHHVNVGFATGDISCIYIALDKLKY